MTEQDFLQSYNIKDYDQPSVAADIALFTLKPSNDTRKVSFDGLQILLIKRANYPHLDKWALPGGFCNPSEEAIETAMRELREETGIDNAYLSETKTFSSPARDPRGWIISDAFTGIVNKKDCHIRTDDEAWDAAWFDIEMDIQKPAVFKNKNVIITEEPIIMSLVESTDDTNELFCKLIRRTEISLTRRKVTWSLMNNDLAFDHGQIIAELYDSIRKTAQNDLRIVFEFLPEYFTIGEAEAAYKAIFGVTERIPNFRRTIEPFVTETDMMSNTDKRFRPAKLYKRNMNNF